MTHSPRMNILYVFILALALVASMAAIMVITARGIPVAPADVATSQDAPDTVARDTGPISG